jgi:hypothetical protein
MYTNACCSPKTLASILAAVLAGTAAGQTTGIVVNGGFEAPVVDAPWAQRLPGSTFGGWTVDNDGQGIVQVATFGSPAAYEGGQCLELNFYVSGGVSQVLATTPGASYRLSFALAGQYFGPDTKHMRIDWNGSELTTLTWSWSGSGGAWQLHNFNVTATGPSTVLHFRGLEEVDGGPYLDAVSVVPLCGAADLGSAGGVQQPDGRLDNNDFIAFINYFFASDPIADRGMVGGVAGSDGVFDNNDFIVFIGQFFAGCG